MIATMSSGIQSGDVTHHQLQLATSPIRASFNVKNIKNNTVLNPIPPVVELLLDLSDICYFIFLLK